MHTPPLSARLAAAAGLVRNQVRLADIGTDHAYLPAALLEQGRIAYAYACDINPQPLAGAQRTLCALQMPDFWETVLCAGLSGLSPAMVDDVVIAGMGFDEIIGILQQGRAFADGAHHFILQPMTGLDKVRRFLAENGWNICREMAVADRGHLYSVMDVWWDGRCHALTPAQAWCGAHLTQRETESQHYLLTQLAAANTILVGLKQAHTHTQDDLDRMDFFGQAVEEISRHIQQMDEESAKRGILE